MTSGGSMQAKFVTKEAQYSVSGEPISVELDVGTEQLNALINDLLGNAEDAVVEFEFLIQDNIIHTSLQEHLEDNGLSAENVTEIEYFEKCPIPEPVDSLLHEDWVSAVHCTSVGNKNLILTGCYDSSVVIWTVDGKKLISLEGHQSPVKAVRWIGSTKTHATFVSTSHDETAIIWNWDHQKNQIETMITCKGHQRSVDCVDVDLTSKKIATSGFDNVVKLWSSSVEETELDVKKDASDVKKSKTDVHQIIRTPLISLASHTEAVTGIQFCSSNEMLTCAMDCTMKMWDIEVGGFSNNLLGSKAFLDLSYSPISRMVVTANADRHVRLWDPRSSEGAVVKSNFTSHSGWVSCVSWSPVLENQFISGSYDNILKLWDTRSTKAPLYDMEGHEERILCCDWNVEDLMVSGAADNKLKVFRHNAPNGNN